MTASTPEPTGAPVLLTPLGDPDAVACTDEWCALPAPPQTDPDPHDPEQQQLIRP